MPYAASVCSCSTNEMTSELHVIFVSRLILILLHVWPRCHFLPPERCQV